MEFGRPKIGPCRAQEAYFGRHRPKFENLARPRWSSTGVGPISVEAGPESTEVGRSRPDFGTKFGLHSKSLIGPRCLLCRTSRHLRDRNGGLCGNAFRPASVRRGLSRCRWARPPSANRCRRGRDNRGTCRRQGGGKLGRSCVMSGPPATRPFPKTTQYCSHNLCAGFLEFLSVFAARVPAGSISDKSRKLRSSPKCVVWANIVSFVRPPDTRAVRRCANPRLWPKLHVFGKPGIPDVSFVAKL